MRKHKKKIPGQNPAELVKSVLGSNDPIRTFISLSKTKRNSLYSYSKLWEADGIEKLFEESSLQKEVFGKYFRHLQKVRKWTKQVLFTALESNLEDSILWIRKCKIFLIPNFVSSFASFLKHYPSKRGLAFLPQIDHMAKLHSDHLAELQLANDEFAKFSKLELLSLLGIWLDEAYVETSLKALDGVQALSPIYYYAVSKVINTHLQNAEYGDPFEDGVK